MPRRLGRHTGAEEWNFASGLPEKEGALISSALFVIAVRPVGTARVYSVAIIPIAPTVVRAVIDVAIAVIVVILGHVIFVVATCPDYFAAVPYGIESRI